MARKSRTDQLTESNIGQHIALSVAAHLARTQLVPDPLSVYDGQHIAEMIDVVANALARVAPVYVADPKAGAPRALTESEREGALVKRGATVLCLRDGRVLSSVSMKRTDLRQAIGILRTIGVPELVRCSARGPEKTPPSPDRFAALATRLAEIERTLEPPVLPERLERTNRLLVSIARDAPQGPVANMAMRLMSALHDLRTSGGAKDQQIALLLGRLRGALDDAQRERVKVYPQ